VGEVGGKDKDELIGHAWALLFPIDWPEPFGLVMIESLACGTPVIAWRNGSVPEIIEEGRTGFIVDNIDDAVRAVGSAAQLRRADCRASFEDHFDAACMAPTTSVCTTAIERPVFSVRDCRIHCHARSGAGSLMEEPRASNTPAHSGDAHSCPGRFQSY